MLVSAGKSVEFCGALREIQMFQKVARQIPCFAELSPAYWSHDVAP